MGAYYNQPTAVVDVPYSARLFDDIGPYNLSGSGSFPPGLNYNRYGLLTGTPTRHGSYTFTIQYSRYVGDPAPPVIGTWTIVVISGHLFRKSNGRLARSSISGHLLTGIAPVGSPTITTLSLPDVYRSVAYSFQVLATGGTTPRTWSVLSGSFPTGISMSSSGLITGTTTVAAGSFTITLKVTDAVGQYATRVFTLYVRQQQVQFYLDWPNYNNYTPEFSLFVVDPAGYGYWSDTDSLDGGDGDFTWLYSPSSTYQGAFPPSYAGQVSPNGGKHGGVCNYTSYYSGGSWRQYPRPPETVYWPSTTSPSGLFRFWAWLVLVGAGTIAPCTLSVNVNNVQIWSDTRNLTWRYYSPLWTFNSATNTVS